jgi:hypothetical protein
MFAIMVFLDHTSITIPTFLKPNFSRKGAKTQRRKDAKENLEKQNPVNAGLLLVHFQCGIVEQSTGAETTVYPQ